MARGLPPDGALAVPRPVEPPIAAPQVALIRRCPDGARSVSLITWGSATLSHLAALAYGLLIVNDLGVAAIGAGNLIGSAAILGAARQRRGSVAVH